MAPLTYDHIKYFIKPTSLTFYFLSPPPLTSEKTPVLVLQYYRPHTSRPHGVAGSVKTGRVVASPEEGSHASFSQHASENIADVVISSRSCGRSNLG